MIQYVIFDLDGTLTDSMPGILNSVRHAMEKLNIPVPEKEVLLDFIGPPLNVSFANHCGLGEEKIQEAIAAYREYFEGKGILENELFPGAERLLSELSKKGVFLAVASSKPLKYVKRILEHFQIASYFSVVAGPEMDGSGGSKQEVLAKALKEIRERKGHSCRGSNTIMVGDRYMDIDAAKAEGIGSVAVTFGYADDAELADMAPDYYARDFAELYRIVTGELTYDTYAKKPAFVKTVEILTPLVLFWAIQLGIYNLLLYVIVRRFGPDERSIVLLKGYLNAAASIAVWPYLAWVYKRDCPPDHSEVETKRKRALLKKDWPQIVSCSLSLAIGLNLVLIFLGVTNASDSYRQVSSNQYLLPIPAGLVIYGILIPFTEEILFRGILQNRIRRYYPTVLVIVLSALLFGCYHGNPVQILYAFFMGIAISAAYEYYRHFAVPVLMHCSANLLVYFITKKVGFAVNGATLLLGSVLILIAAAITAYYIRVLLRRYSKHSL